MAFRLPPRKENSHKGTFGKVLNISGSRYYRGAAYLSSVSALKIGCGYVVLCSCDEVLDAVTVQAPEVVLSPLEELSEKIKEADTIEIGCGLSTSLEAKNIVKKVLSSKVQVPVVLDADGLNILSGLKKPKLPENLIITPHPKEASRLLGVEIEKIITNTEFYAKELSKKFNCTAVLKTNETIVSSVECRTYKNITGNSALAKSGSGDVLTGIIAGLLAQKMDIFEACKLAVYLHGLAADIARNDLTEYGVLASDLIRYIPSAIKKLI
ncbi:NAD(P)H-hydrate dehydratase [bacterium]|nr:NAD(P)H-hydrate dehydratase [bacterium]